MHRYCLHAKQALAANIEFPNENGVFDICDQARKGAWGMSWHQKILKGVEDCDMSGGVVKQTLIPEFPNRL